mmetsp:Transcript_7589/g.18734  ORF Transcript_7589/g.18734 Transcript_7589/m.18734 type:complete len:148 (+) Transcript_7589:698-1141(+)
MQKKQNRADLLYYQTDSVPGCEDYFSLQLPQRYVKCSSLGNTRPFFLRRALAVLPFTLFKQPFKNRVSYSFSERSPGRNGPVEHVFGRSQRFMAVSFSSSLLELVPLSSGVSDCSFGTGSDAHSKYAHNDAVATLNEKLSAKPLIGR